jgi:hypothetical protein
VRELNWKPDQAVELSVLGEGACTGPARMVDVSGKRIHLAAALPVLTGAAVRLEWDEQLVLGEVLHTEPGGFWLEIHHRVLDTAAQTWQRQGWQR